MKKEGVEELSLFPIPTYTCRIGDLWRLGQHYLLCGDSTNRDDVMRLRDAVGEPYAATISDPPYGEIQAAWDIATFAFIPFLKEVCKREATCIFFCSLPFGFDLHHAMLAAGWQFRFDAIWMRLEQGSLPAGSSH